MRRRAAYFRRWLDRQLNQNVPHLQFAQRLHPQGRRGAGHGADLRRADGARRSTSRTRCTAWPRAAVRVSADGLTYRFRCARKPVPRRHAAHRARRRLLAHDAEGEGPSRSSPRCCATSRRGGGSTTATVVVRFADKRGARRAAVRRRTADLLEGLLRQATVRRDRRSKRRSARGPYRVGRFEAGRYIEFERVKDWWGADLPVARGQNNFDTAALRILPRPRSRLRRLHRQELSVPRGVHLAHLGDALRFPGLQGRPGQARRHCRTRRRRARRAGSSIPGATNSRIPRCARR